MKIGLSDAYRMIKNLDERRARPVLDHKSIVAEISDADEDIHQALNRFKAFAEKASGALKNDPDANVDEEIVYLNIYASQIADTFEDFLESLSAVLKEENP